MRIVLLAIVIAMIAMFVYAYNELYILRTQANTLSYRLQELEKDYKTTATAARRTYHFLSTTNPDFLRLEGA